MPLGPCCAWSLGKENKGITTLTSFPEPLHVLVVVLLLKLLDEKRLLVWITRALLLCVAPELAECLLVQGILQVSGQTISISKYFSSFSKEPL